MALNPKLKPEIKRRWIEALRSGQYQQTRGALRRLGTDTNSTGESYPEGFCCLGVLCDVIAGDIDGQWLAPDESGALAFSAPDSDPKQGLLPDSVMSFVQAEDSLVPLRNTVSLRTVMRHTSLVGINDEGASFSEISDIIEQHL